MALFEACGIHKRFGHQVVLEHIDLRFESGRLSGNMGPNGSGKTTCFNVLTGWFKPDRGRVVFDGEDITRLSPNAIARKGISRSFQIMSLFDEYSPSENVLIALPEVRERGFNMIDRLAADGEVVALLGPNGSGKTTLFELITGSNMPSAGSVMVMGRNIHDVKYGERDRLAIHYHQSYQVRHFRRTRPSFLMQPAGHDYPMVHLFDEPQFNTQDGYIGFMLDFFRGLRSEGRLVFVCLHPNEPYHLELMEEVCERFVFVLAGRVREYPDFRSMLQTPDVRAYLGRLAQT